MPQTTRPRVLLADDHPGILSAVQRLLAPSCEIVGQVKSGGEVLGATRALKPDILVLDIIMPGLNGLDVCCQIKHGVRHTEVIILTASFGEDIKQQALDLGAAAFVLKHCLVDDLLDAIFKVFPNREHP
jgi:DNA-binding NarL/FixJ family response regulator